MKKRFINPEIISAGLAIFSMFFGAGNLMYPIKVGISSGARNFIGMSAFLITSVILPLTGLIAMILFEGNYKSFFNRLGKIPGGLFIIASLLIIGPIIAIPRIVTLSYTMMEPFIPQISLEIFTILFLGLTFLCTYRESKIVDLLGKFISPALLISLFIIIFKGMVSAAIPVEVTTSNIQIFKENFWRGYETLDLLGSIFFSSIILHILKLMHKNEKTSKLALVGFKSGTIGILLLALVYIGMSYLGVYHSHGLENLNPGILFREVSFRVLGCYGALIIATAVLMACLSTAIALAAVVADFIQKDVSKNKLSYANSLGLVLVASIPLSLYGLKKILELTAGPIIYVGYPILITLTILNMAYKLFDFKPIKIPVLVVGILVLWSYLSYF